MNIWNEINLEQVDTPLKVLRELTIGLSEKTSGVLDAHVKTNSENQFFIHYFQITCPKLNGYTYNLIKVTHDIFLYPCEIFDLSNPEYKAMSTIEISQFAINAFNRSTPIERPIIANFSAQNEPELKKCLENILKSDKTQTIIKSLFTQSIQI